MKRRRILCTHTEVFLERETYFFFLSFYYLWSFAWLHSHGKYVQHLGIPVQKQGVWPPLPDPTREFWRENVPVIQKCKNWRGISCHPLKGRKESFFLWFVIFWLWEMKENVGKRTPLKKTLKKSSYRSTNATMSETAWALLNLNLYPPTSAHITLHHQIEFPPSACHYTPSSLLQDLRHLWSSVLLLLRTQAILWTFLCLCHKIERTTTVDRDHFQEKFIILPDA